MEICYNEESAWRINEHVELPNRGNDHIQHKRHMDKVKGFIPILSDRANRQNEGDRICQTGSDSQLLPREIGNIINSNESGKCLEQNRYGHSCRVPNPPSNDIIRSIKEEHATAHTSPRHGPRLKPRYSGPRRDVKR